MKSFLYHATYRIRLRDIKRLGLGAKQKKNWDISKDSVVYLSSDPELAFSFAESAEDVAESVYNSGIVVLAIPVELLDLRYMAKDKNSRGSNTDFIYKQVINPTHIQVITARKGIVGRLTELKRVPAYE